jgi:hypothetical protein
MKVGHMPRALIVLAACALLVIVGGQRVKAGAQTGAPEITDAQRAATLHFAPGVTPADQAWILAAVATARPEAQRLIAEVDGLVEVRTDLQMEPAIGLAHVGPDGLSVNFDAARLNGDRALDRNVVVLHELGHIVDYLLVDDDLVAQLDAGIPPAGPCQSAADYGACTAVEERFADTFAKWALRGRFSLAGSGYGVPTPPSLEDWGRPLGRLAVELGR